MNACALKLSMCSIESVTFHIQTRYIDVRDAGCLYTRIYIYARQMVVPLCGWVALALQNGPDEEGDHDDQ